MPGIEASFDVAPLPSWWAGSTTIRFDYVGGTHYTVAAANVEVLPHGVTFLGSDNSFTPWAQIVGMSRAS